MAHRYRIRGRLKLAAVTALAASPALGCGGDLPDEPAAAGAPGACPPGQLLLTGGTCAPVGIQGCAEMFIDEDGLCRPTIEKCPAGTIPKFTEGCVPVGIQGCAAMFMEDDGLCHPSIDKCPAGMIPKFDEGCVPVGIPDCAPEFLEDDGLCHPRMAKCPAGTFATPQKGCVPIDGQGGCGAGTWGNIADGPGTIYVDPSYAGGDGDGSREKPATTIAEAQALVPYAGRIALAAGTYNEGVLIDRPLTVEGRCASLVRLVGGVHHAAIDYNATVLVDDAEDVVVRGIGIGGDGIGVLVDHSPNVTIERVHVLNARYAGILAIEAHTSITVSDSLIERTRPQADLLDLGLGIILDSGVEATVQNSALFENRRAGIMAYYAILLATGNLIEGTLPREDDSSLGAGIAVQGQASAELSANAVVGNRYMGILVGIDGATAAIHENYIEGTLPQESDGTRGEGVVIAAQGSAEVRANAILDNHQAGIFVQDEGTEGTVTGNLIRGTRAAPTGSGGPGIVAGWGPKAAIEDNALVENCLMGLYLRGGVDAIAKRNLVERTVASHGQGHGIAVEAGGASAVLEGNAIVDSLERGLNVIEASSVTATHNLVEDTKVGGAYVAGVLLSIVEGSRVSLTGNAIIGNHYHGMYVTETGGEATATGNLVRDTLGAGAAIYQHVGGRTTLADTAIVNNRFAGVAMYGSYGVPGPPTVLTGMLVEGTLPTNVGYGMGIMSSLCNASVTSSLVLGSNAAGISLVALSTGDISDTLVEEVRLGSALMQDGSLLTDLGDGILVLDSSATVTHTAVRDCDRAGVLFENSSGSLAGVHSTDNEYGLVLQGSPWPSYENAGNVFTPNRTIDISTDGDLPVPDGNIGVPDAPE